MDNLRRKKAMDTKLRFSVIGCGRMGLRRTDLITNHPLSELRCIEDCNSEIAVKIGEKYGCYSCSGWENAVNRSDVDCVMVSVPNKYHHEIVIAALEAGKHVFCEKPLARNPIEAHEMVESAIKSKRFLKVGSNLRYFPNVLKAKELVETGEIGHTIFARGWIGHAGWQIGTWYSESDIIGGGTFLDNGCHLLDLYRMFLGEVESCTGLVSTNLWPIAPLEDNGMALFKFTNGSTAYIQSSWTEWEGYMYLEIYGSEGLIRIDNRGQSCTTTIRKKDGSTRLFDYSKESPRSYLLEFDEYIKSIISNRQPVPSGFDGLRVVQMVNAVYESSRLGKTISISSLGSEIRGQ